MVCIAKAPRVHGRRDEREGMEIRSEYGLQQRAVRSRGVQSSAAMMGFMRDEVQTMKSFLKVAAVAFLMLIAGQVSLAQVAAVAPDDAPHALPVSIVTLLAMPASSSAKQVQVSGFLVLDFEGNALYLHEEDYKEGLPLNSIYVSLTPEQQQKYKSLDKTYVTIEASFQKRRKSEDIFTGVLFHVREIRRINVHH
jgi:hypothetical protein